MNGTSGYICDALAGMISAYAMTSDGGLLNVSDSDVSNGYSVIKAIGIHGFDVNVRDIDEEHILVALAFFREMPQTSSDGVVRQMAIKQMPKAVNECQKRLRTSDAFRFGFVESLRRQLQKEYESTRKNGEYQENEKVHEVDSWLRGVTAQ